MLIPMIDYLSFGIDFDNYQDSIENLLPELSLAKEKSKEYSVNKQSEKAIVCICGLSFEVLPNGANGYSFILNCYEYQIKFAQFRSTNKDFYPIMVIIHSQCLWSYGPENAYLNIINWLKNIFVNNMYCKISRIDVCCHNDLLHSNELSIDRFKGEFQKCNVRLDNRKISGIEFGSRKSMIYCRIYNKLLEVNEMKNKLWFHQIWSEHGFIQNEVWNIEFELKRDFFNTYDLDSVEEVFDSLRSIWEKCTSEWLVMIDRNRTRTENCSISSEWIQISNSFNHFSSNPLVKKNEQLLADANALIPAAVGYITTVSARLGQDNIDRAIDKIKASGQQYLAHKNHLYRSKIAEKIELLGKRG